MLFRSGITFNDDNDPQIQLCNPCNSDLRQCRLPSRSLANYRWIGPVPPELQNLTWIEEQLIARSHLVGRVLRLQHSRTAYHGIKGNIVLLPQDTSCLITLLPISPSLLPEFIRVVWTGSSMPTHSDLQHVFTVHTQRVYDTLQWLLCNNDDYRDNVTFDYDEFATWPPVFVAEELFRSMSHLSDSHLDDASRSGFATKEIDSNIISSSISLSTSAILDVNCVFQSRDAATLKTLAIMTSNLTINVVNDRTPKNDYDDESYFTSAFPLLFPYGTEKHIDNRRRVPLSFSLWLSLLLTHSSRYFSTSLILTLGVSKVTLHLLPYVSTLLDVVIMQRKPNYIPVDLIGRYRKPASTCRLR